MGAQTTRPDEDEAEKENTDAVARSASESDGRDGNSVAENWNDFGSRSDYTEQSPRRIHTAAFNRNADLRSLA